MAKNVIMILLLAISLNGCTNKITIPAPPVIKSAYMVNNGNAKVISNDIPVLKNVYEIVILWNKTRYNMDGKEKNQYEKLFSIFPNMSKEYQNICKTSLNKIKKEGIKLRYIDTVKNRIIYNQEKQIILVSADVIFAISGGKYTHASDNQYSIRKEFLFQNKNDKLILTDIR